MQTTTKVEFRKAVTAPQRNEQMQRCTRQDQQHAAKAIPDYCADDKNWL